MTFLNQTAHHVLKNDMDLILPHFPTNRIENLGIITLLISGFIGLAYEDISSFLHNRRHKALHNVVMETKANIQCNKLMHLEDSMVMYDIYNAEPLEKLIDMVHHRHNITTPNEKIFTGQLNTAYMWYINTHGTQGIQYYSINSLLYLRTIRENLFRFTMNS